MTILGILLLAIGVIVSLVIWIQTIIKCFKAGETLWGILTILFSPLLGVIWLFMKGQSKSAIIWIVVSILAGVGYVAAILPMINKAVQEGMQQMPQ